MPFVACGMPYSRKCCCLPGMLSHPDRATCSLWCLEKERSVLRGMLGNHHSVCRGRRARAFPITVSTSRLLALTRRSEMEVRQSCFAAGGRVTAPRGLLPVPSTTPG